MNISDLLHDAVAEIEPADRIDELRARTANPARSAARPWFYAAGATVLATAAAVTAFAVLGNDSAPDSGPAHEGHELETFLVPAYFVGDSGNGEARLYREFDEAQGHDALDAALERIQRPPSDPDYRTTWAHGSFESASIENGTIEVEIGDAGGPPAQGGPAAQQVVYTLQGAAGEQLPIQFVSDGEPVGGRHQAVPQHIMLNPMSISDPAEGSSYSGSFTARGRADSFEANVRWELRDEDDKVVADGFTTADGWGGKLYKWETEIDLTGVPFGFYTFVALTDDPSGGAEGNGPYTDTRLITVR